MRSQIKKSKEGPSHVTARFVDAVSPLLKVHMSGSASDSDNNVLRRRTIPSSNFLFSTSLLAKLAQNDPSQTDVWADRLDTRGPEITKLYHALQQNTVLDHLLFSFPIVMPEGSHEFYRILSEAKFRLRFLKIVCPNHFGFFRGLFRILSTAPGTRDSLETLDLHSDFLPEESGNEDDDVKESLFNIFVRMPSLRNVWLHSEGIPQNGLLGLAQGLAQNDSVERLSLPGDGTVSNPIVYSSIAQALIANKTLTQLVMARCDLDDSGMNALLTALQENQTLRVLNLNSNNFTRHGIETILVPLLPGLNLYGLYLKKNFGGYFCHDATEEECDKLVGKIVMSLQNNSTLEVLDLGYSYDAEISDEARSLYPWDVREERMAAGKPFYSTLDQRLQLYLDEAHCGFNKFWQLRLAESESRQTADRNSVGRSLVPLRLLVPRILHRLYQACHLRELEGDMYFYVRKMAEWGDFGPRQGACKRGACF